MSGQGIKQNGVQAWAVAIVCTLCGIVAAASVMKINPCASLIMADFGIGEAMESYLLSICSIIGVIIAIPAGLIIDRVGPRAVGIVSLIVMILGGVVGSLTNNYWVLLVARLFEGFAFGTWSILGPIFINAWFTPNKRGLPMGIFSVWVGWCMLFIFRVANLMIDRSDPTSWHNVWWFTVICGIVVLIAFILVAKMPKSSEAVKPAEPVSKGSKEKTFSIEAMKSVPVWCIVIIFLIFSWAQQVITGYTSTYCQSELGVDIITANNLTSAWTLGNVVGAVLVGFALNKITSMRARSIMVLVLAVLSFVCYITCFTYSVEMANMYLLVFGFICIMFTPLGFNILPDIAVSPKYLGFTMALAGCTSAIGHVFVAFGGIAIENAGYSGCMVMLGVLGIVYIITAIVFVVSVNGKKGSVAQGSKR